MTLHTKKETAESLRISTRTLERLCHARKIGYIKIGKKVLFTEKHLQDFITKNSIKKRMF